MKPESARKQAHLYLCLKRLLGDIMHLYHAGDLQVQRTQDKTKKESQAKSLDVKEDCPLALSRPRVSFIILQLVSVQQKLRRRQIG